MADYSKFSNHRLLSAEEEEDLGGKVVAYKEMLESLGSGWVLEDLDERTRNIIEEGEEAFKDLVEGNLRLAFNVAWKFANAQKKVSKDDLIQESCMGLAKAAMKFNPNKFDNRFSTYATWWCRQACQRAITEGAYPIKISSNIEGDMREAANKLDDFPSLNKENDRDELAEILGWDREHLDNIFLYMERTKTVPLSQKVNGGEVYNLDLPDVESRSPEDTGVGSAFLEHLMKALHVLSDEEREIIEYHYGLSGGGPTSLNEVGEKFGLVREKARQIEARGLSRLRHPSAGLVQFFSAEDLE